MHGLGKRVLIVDDDGDVIAEGIIEQIENSRDDFHVKTAYTIVTSSFATASSMCFMLDDYFEVQRKSNNDIESRIAKKMNGKIICPYCGIANDPESNFCGEKILNAGCGARIYQLET